MFPHLKQGLQDCVKGGRESDWMELDRIETEGETNAASRVSLTSTSKMASSDSPVGVKRGWTALLGLWGDASLGDASWGEGERGDADRATRDGVASCPDPATWWSGIYTVMADGAGGLACFAQFPFRMGQTVGAGGASLYTNTIHALSCTGSRTA